MPDYGSTVGEQRLDHLLTSSPELLFDDTSKLVFFSDAHRSNKDDHDAFAPNESLFLTALHHYYQHEFTYLELGDGDDLWQAPRFEDIQQAYPRVFELLHQFKSKNRLHLIVGNHEIQREEQQRVQKGEFLAQEGLVLRHRQTDQRLLAVHGHQVDIWCDKFNRMSQQIVNFTKKALDLVPTWANHIIAKRLSRWYKNQQEKLTQQLLTWARKKQQLIISGHTHWPIFPETYQDPYFNTGCCINPGYITGIEIQNGTISLTKWFACGKQRYKQMMLTPAHKLTSFNQCSPILSRHNNAGIPSGSRNLKVPKAFLALSAAKESK